MISHSTVCARALFANIMQTSSLASDYMFVGVGKLGKLHSSSV
jgi:hypothetical protein